MPKFKDVLVVRRKRKSNDSNPVTLWLAKKQAEKDIKKELKQLKKERKAHASM